MFTDDRDKDYIIEELIKWIAPVEKPRETLTAPFIGTQFPEDLRQGNPRELVLDAVRLCLGDAWNHTPPWLVLLLKLLPQDEKIVGLIEVLRRPPPPSPNPLDSTILNNVIPFVDRAPLRLHMRRLATSAADAQPILVVNGSTKSGKSYSRNYIEYFSYSQPSTITYPFEFDAELGVAIGAEQVARDLVAMMGRPMDSMPQPNTNQKLYVQQLATWVLNEAAQTASSHWFILDNFRGEKLRGDTRDLLIALSDRITKGVFQKRCRLILIGFDRALLTVDPGKVVEERVAALPAGEVERSIGEILQQAPGLVSLPRIATLLLASLPNDERRMAELNLRLRALLYAVPEVRQILADRPSMNYEEVLVKMLEDLLRVPPEQDRLLELQKQLEELRESMGEV